MGCICYTTHSSSSAAACSRLCRQAMSKAPVGAPPFGVCTGGQNAGAYCTVGRAGRRASESGSRQRRGLASGLLVEEQSQKVRVAHSSVKLWWAIADFANPKHADGKASMCQRSLCGPITRINLNYQCRLLESSCSVFQRFCNYITKVQNCVQPLIFDDRSIERGVLC